MDWINSVLRKPPQGKKILCFDKGDIYVAIRFKDYWFPIPFLDARLATIRPPDYWKDINPPPDFTGKIHVVIEGEFLDMDQLSKKHPQTFDDFVKDLLDNYFENRKEA